MTGVSLIAAFVAGLLSFISPCILPLIPGYVSFVSGVTLEDLRAADGRISPPVPGRTQRRIVISSIAFIAGFSLVFITLGASATALGQALASRLALLARIAGVVIILFGLHVMGVLRLRWLDTEARLPQSRRPAGLTGAFFVGVAFAFGWTPCIGPILAGILALAATERSVWRGVRLLAVYSVGLGIPFLATSLAINRFFAAFAAVRRHYRTIELTSGMLLVAVGVLILSDRFTIIARVLTPYLPTF
jgi:cytochrome c-type biogenesis protein